MDPMPRVLSLILISLLCASSALADFTHDEDWGLRTVAFEAGPWQIVGAGRRVVNDPVMLYLTFGINLTKAFYAPEPYEPLHLVPKLGIGLGSTVGTPRDFKNFYDLLLKVRYWFGSRGNRFRPYVDAGPGYINFISHSFQLEAGGGFDFFVGKGGGTIGVNAQYKELFHSAPLRRGVVILGTLAFHF